MLLAPLALLGGMLAGWLGGGSLRTLARLELRRPSLVALAALSQLAGAIYPRGYGPGLAASAVLASGFLLLNRRLAGLPLVAIGIASNAVAVLANGVMPVSVWAAQRAGVSLSVLDDPHYEEGNATTKLRPLTDVIPLPLPVLPLVVSVGDVLIAAGSGLLVATAMREWVSTEGAPVAKKKRKARARKKNKANHGKRPNC